VRLEAEAKLCIQEHIREGTLELAWSYLLDFENAANPFAERRTTISRWRQYATIDVEETATMGRKECGRAQQGCDGMATRCAEQGHGADAVNRAAHAWPFGF
jgi:hypothetical protein